MIRAALIIVLISVYIESHSQKDADRANAELLWNEFYTLQWDDFRGEPDRNSHGDAGTAVQIKAKPFTIDNRVHYDVTAIFNRHKSWARDTSTALLAHEQLHFDLAELYARKIRKRLKELSDQGVNEIKELNEAIRELLLESNKVDAQYDAETLHGGLLTKQAAWERKIKSELAALGGFKKKKRIIRSQ